MTPTVRPAIALAALAAALAALPASAAAAPPPPPPPRSGDRNWRDEPMRGTLPQYLDSAAGVSWTLARWDGELTVPALVPGDVISDLAAADVLADPIYELTFLDGVWDDGEWTYSASFALDAQVAGAAPGDEVLLVLESAQMVADVALNGQWLGFCADQFLRYNFSVAQLLKQPPALNTLSVAFNVSSDPRGREGRINGALGGWDWGPIRRFTSDPPRAGGGGVADDTAMTRGIVRSLYLLRTPAGSASIVQTVPLVHYAGAYPTTVLTDATAGPFLVEVQVLLSNPAAAPLVGVAVQAAGSWGGNANRSAPISLPPGVSLVSVWLAVPPGAVRLWWTADVQRGPQPLYDVNVSLIIAGAAAASDSRRVGFKVFALVTDDDSEPSRIAGVEGSGSLTMRLKLNGANMFARGADIIPMEWLRGRESTQAYRRMIQSAADANFNIIRVDGIDMIFPDALYDACDELGILVYHDMQYSQSQPNPVASAMQRDELIYSIRRMAPHRKYLIESTTHRPTNQTHPLDSSLPQSSEPRHLRRLQRENTDYCNTCFSAPAPPAASAAACCDLCAAASADDCWCAVFDPDDQTCYFKPRVNVSVPIMKDGVTAVWPAGRGPPPPLPPPGPQPSSSIENHGPYLHGSGMPAVDSVGVETPPPIVPDLYPAYDIGVQRNGTFTSEFGATAFSSFESLSATLAPEHWSLHGGAAFDTCTPSNFFQKCAGGNVMAQRNYANDEPIQQFFGNLSRPDEVGEAPFARDLLFSMLAQAFVVASEVQTDRSHNHWGIMLWQLNEIWPTGGWGSTEYGPASGYTAGQIAGGRWKPLQHYFERYLFRAVFAACGADGRCYAKNDDAVTAGGYGSVAITRRLLRIADGKVVATFAAANASAPPGGGLALAQGGGVSSWFCLDDSPLQQPQRSCNASAAEVQAATGCGEACVLLLSVDDLAAGAPLAANAQLLANPSVLAPLLSFRGNLTVSCGAAPALLPDGSLPLYVSFPIDAPAGAIALLVTLTSRDVPGRFSDNAFALVGEGAAGEGSASLPPLCAGPAAACAARVAAAPDGTAPPTLSFIPWVDGGREPLPAPALAEALLATLRVQHLGNYA